MGYLFSIIIPTYNRKTQLEECIDSLKSLQFPSTTFEVIIVDDGSSDDTKVFLESITATNVRNFSNPRKGPASARNFGAKNALGENLIFLDDDCTVEPNWLNKFKSLIGSLEYAVIGGSTVNKSQSSISQVMEYVTSYYQIRLNTDGNPFYLTSNNLMCKKDDFLILGGFDETFPFAGAEDRDLIRRFNNASIKVLFDKNIFVYHHHLLNLSKLFRQQFSYGKGSYIFYKKTINSQEGFNLSGTIVLNFSMIKEAFYKKGFLRGIFYSFVIILSQIFITSGYLYQKYFNSQTSGTS